jgi:histidinol-phosphate aminotransferase|tara:strand:- start:2651 stop:3733 length:1083 start_codon:yes stop_codon:yes gene_type:complete
MKLPKAKTINAEKYVAGLSLFKQKLARVKLSANESALGPSPKAIKEYIKVSKNFKRYPDSDGTFLRKVIAKKFKLDKNRIILGNGSDQVFELVCKAFLNKNDEVVISKYSFIIYRIYSKLNFAKIIYAPENNFTSSVDNILSCVTSKTKVVFIANPNNPTGTYITKNEMLRLRKKLRSDILLVVDDAYFEYIDFKDYENGLKLFSKFKNVLITRTFSKIYGLAGLRVGWAYSSKDIVNELYKIKPPFNVNRPALFAASVALKDTSWLNKEIKHIRKWSQKFYELFRELNIHTNRTSVNFLLINFDKIKKSSKQVFSALAKKGILLRQMDVYSIKNSLRVTIGNNKENLKLISELKKILNV